jgi:hypothetical protein
VRLLFVSVAAVVVAISALGHSPATAVYAEGDPHAYFNALIARADFQRGYSLRPNPAISDPANPYFGKQLAADNQGGLHAFDCDPSTADQAFRYSPSTDTDPHAQDAAKAAIPAFAGAGGCGGHTLTQALPASASGTAEILRLNDVTNNYSPVNQRQLRIDNEVLRLRVCTTAEGGDGAKAYIDAQNVVCVIRGQYGTAPVAHSIGATVKLSVNQMSNYLNPAIGTQDGYTYLITWDAYWTDSYVGVGSWDQGQKTFQITGGKNNKLFEPKLLFAAAGEPGFDASRHVGIVNARSYNSLNTGQTTWAQTDGNTMGPSMTDHTTLEPRVGTFVIKPNVWTRWWIKIDQRANDWDYFDMWVADENTEPVLIYSRVPMSVSQGGTSQNAAEFWFALGNSNTEYLRGSFKDLVSYFRNYAVLRNPQNVPGLLLRPLAGVPLPPPTTLLAAPQRLRILK